jgi:hypothetical protein
MAWYYEILGKNDEVLEQSEPVYASQFEAQYAAYTRVKEKPSLFGPVISSRKRPYRQLTRFLRRQKAAWISLSSIKCQTGRTAVLFSAPADRTASVVGTIGVGGIEKGSIRP